MGKHEKPSDKRRDAGKLLSIIASIASIIAAVIQVIQSLSKG